ncbi:MAG: hypothetical protein US11_C0001G0155 [Candidatus Roizmanbacteria bacterium GW2011_GWA2_36_23]|uniref:YoaR-like putative peptidoglycan binding domain-containing protein n=1 Tax=Candidatus Roizmanbacteria bacterium GW2011_GWA2_36_23 TaxID=1618480 RepID=A0A0G0HE58_9BACT|nr:MAG: hypothetical protein US11_C0001G0155 [Candidatus Roizmanbacteria bacterium GW2011_GWA2_36_23]
MVMKANKFTIFILIFSVACIIGYLFYAKDSSYRNKVYPGVYIDRIHFGGKTKEESIQYFMVKNKSLGRTKINIKYKNSTIASLKSEELNIQYDGKDIVERAYLIGRSSHFPSKIIQKINSLLGWKKYEFDSKLSYKMDKINELLNLNEEKYNKPAKNALFEFENGKVTSFRKEEKGNKIETNLFLKELDKNIQTLKIKPTNLNVKLTSAVIEPEISLAKANKYGIEELIGEGKSDYSHSIPERIHNIILASSKFHGVLIPKDKVFSFNKIIGDISSSTGYKPAYIIKGGKTVLGDGGGVCQISTTLFRAALNTGLPIIERNPHAYRVGYYENDSKPGFDATVFAPTVDFKFKNDTLAYILIQSELDKENNILRFKFYGKKDNRNVEMSPVSVYDIQPPPPPIFQDDPTQKKGFQKQIDFAAWGAKSYFEYKVKKDSKVITEHKFYSSYRPWQAIYLVGIAD